MPNSNASYWIALLTQSKLPRRLAKDLLYRWCVEGNQPLASLYDLDPAQVAVELDISEDQARQLRSALDAAPAVASEIAALDKQGIRVLLRTDIAYPDTLAEGLAERMQPYFVYTCGSLTLSTEPGVSILGSTQPSEAAQAIALSIGQALARQGRHLLGGYTRGIDRIAVDGALAEGGSAVVILPLGIRRFESALRSLRGAIDAERLLLLSPYPPETPYTDALAAARIRIVVAMSDLVVLVEPPAPNQFPGLTEAMQEGKRVAVWRDRADDTHAPWVDAGAETFETPDQALGIAETDVEMIDLADPSAEVTEVVDAAPMTFDDATSAIESLSHTGQLPDALVRRLRERGWADSDES